MGLFCHGMRLNISKNGMLCLINTAIDEAMHQIFDFEEQMGKIFQIITEITVCRAVCRVFDCACGAEIVCSRSICFVIKYYTENTSPAGLTSIPKDWIE